jgi:GntR family transcriptional regulator/MocR family aminotransferase
MAHLRDAIRSGSLREGTRLPATRTLAADLRVSRGVVVRAYEQLTAEGYLQTRQGSGTEVAAVPEAADSHLELAPRPPTNPGLPAGSLFPRTEWLRAAHRALIDLPDADLGYPDPAGLPRLRDELSTYLGRVRALIANPERIVVVNGFGQSCRLIADVLLSRGTTEIAVEDPGSIGLREQLTDVGMTCRPIMVDEQGIRVDLLARSGLRAVVVTPAHQFPTGAVMSAERRHALLDWARESEALVIEDDYDAEYRYDRTPIGALQGLGPEEVVYGGSVSKTLAPALRLGWLVLPENLVADVRDAKYTADLGTSVLDQATLAEFLASGAMDKHIRRTSPRYRERRDRLVAELGRRLPSWTVTGTAAGLHLVVHLPSAVDEAETVRLAQRCGLDARPLSSYAATAPDRSGLVIGYGHQRTDALARAAAALADAIG